MSRSNTPLARGISRKSRRKQLTGRFNPFLKSVILRVSEARDLGDVDRYAFYETTKTMWAARRDMLPWMRRTSKRIPS